MYTPEKNCRIGQTTSARLRGGNQQVGGNLPVGGPKTPWGGVQKEMPWAKLPKPLRIGPVRGKKGEDTLNRLIVSVVINVGRSKSPQRSSL